MAENKDKDKDKDMTKAKQKRAIRARHTGRLELRGQTFIARWMEDGKRFTESTGIRLADFGGDKDKAREAADRWLTRRLAPLRARDSIVKNERDETAVRAQLEGLYKGELAAIAERRNDDTADGIPPVSVAEAFDRLLASPEYKTPKPHTLNLTKGRIVRFTNWLTNNHPSVKLLREVSPAIAREYAAKMKVELTGGTYNAHLITLNQVWKVLADEIKGDGNPWAKIPKQTAAKSLRRALTDAELKKIFDGAKSDRDLTLLFGFMLYTGMRLSDACLVKWENVKFERGIVDFIALKTGARCKPPLLPELRSMLLQTPEEERSGYVMPPFAKSYMASPRPMSNLVTAHFVKCGVETSVVEDDRKRPAATAHSFRHTFISKCGNAGVPLAIVQGWVGHMSKDMTENYFHDDERSSLMYAKDIPALQALPCEVIETECNELIPASLKAEIESLSREQLLAVQELIAKRL